MTNKKTIHWVLGGIALLILPLILQSFGNAWVRIADLALLYVLLALGLNIVVGFAGLLDLGYIAFYAVGAYMMALLGSPHLSNQFEWIHNMFPNGLHLIVWWVIPLGAGLAALFGILLGTPVLKLRGDYLAIVTLGFGEIIRVILLNTEAVGGARGMYGIPKTANFFWVMSWMFICVLVIWRLVRSSHGRGFMSVREDEIAAESVGINTTQFKTKAFVISSFFAGIAG